MNRLVLFAHYDSDGEVKPFVLRHLEALRRLGGRIEFSSNSPVPPAAAAALGKLVDRFVVRENVGYDFGMWRDALASRDLSGVDELVLTNSSVIGPLWPLAPIFERMRSEGWDFWGMTECGQYAPHLQSYFLVFARPVLASAAFRRFFDSILAYRSKKQAILAYEVGLSAYLWEAGFRGGAAFPGSRLAPTWLADLLVRRTPPWAFRPGKNPTLYYPDRLLAAGMPYVKVDLLRRYRWRARLLGVGRHLRGLPAVP